MSRLLNPVATSCGDCRLHELCFPCKDIKRRRREFSSAGAIKGKRRGADAAALFCESSLLASAFPSSVPESREAEGNKSECEPAHQESFLHNNNNLHLNGLLSPH